MPVLCCAQFSPTEVLAAVSIPEYIQFIIHSLEYKTLIVEQLSEEAERAALALLQGKEGSAAPGTGTGSPCGVLLYTCVIRDLDGVGFEHVGAKGQEIVRAVIGVASANYPGDMKSLKHQSLCCIRLHCTAPTLHYPDTHSKYCISASAHLSQIV